MTFLIFSLKGKDVNYAWFLLFMGAGVTGIVLTWKAAYSICSVIVCILATAGYGQKKPEITKILSIFVCIAQIIYALFINSVSVIINECITLTSIAIFFVRFAAEKRKRETEE